MRLLKFQADWDVVPSKGTWWPLGGGPVPIASPSDIPIQGRTC